MEGTIYSIWQKSKKWVVLTSAIVPIFLFGFDLIFVDSLITRGTIAISVIVFQLGVLIGVVYEVHVLLKKRTPRRISRIQLNDDFWDSKARHKSLYMLVLNGDRFIELIREKNKHVEEVLLMVPSDKAIEVHYHNDISVDDRARAVRALKDAIAMVANQLATLKASKHIGSFEIRRIGSFPLDFLAVVDARVCLVGKYKRDPLRKASVGLKSVSWAEKDPQLVTEYVGFFEDTWQALDPGTGEYIG